MRLPYVRQVVRHRKWVLGNNAVVFEIVSKGRENHHIVIRDNAFGKYDYKSGKFIRFNDAKDDILQRIRAVAYDVKEMFG